MVSVNPVSFTAPNVTGTPQQPMPRSRSELLAYMLEKGSPATPDYSSVSSPVEGFAKALTSGLQGYMAKKTLQGEDEKRLAQANATADLLFGPTADGAPDPRRDAYVKALTAGVDIPVGGAIASKLGLGDPPEPIKLGQGDTLVDPRNYQPLYTAPQPVKPYSKPAEVWDDWNRGFFPTEADRDAALATLDRPGVSVTLPGGQTLPTPPFGQAYKQNPDGTVAINPQTGMPEIITVPGGPAAIEQGAATAAEAGRAESGAESADIVLGAINDADTIFSANPTWTTGLGGAIMLQIPGSGAVDLQEAIAPIEASIAFDRLQKMREDSPTGGALGAVSERELLLLSATIASLKQSQSSEAFKRNLNKVKTVYRSIARKFAAYPGAAGFGFAPPEFYADAGSGGGTPPAADGWTIEEIP